MDFRPTANDFVIAADAGLRYLEQGGILADLVIGDFDTLEEIPIGANVVRLSCEKDDTDMLAAVREGIKAGLSHTRRDETQDFYDVWQFQTDIELSEIRMQESEIVAVKLVNREELLAMYHHGELHPLLKID